MELDSLPLGLNLQAEEGGVSSAALVPELDSLPVGPWCSSVEVDHTCHKVDHICHTMALDSSMHRGLACCALQLGVFYKIW